MRPLVAAILLTALVASGCFGPDPAAPAGAPPPPEAAPVHRLNWTTNTMQGNFSFIASFNLEHNTTCRFSFWTESMAPSSYSLVNTVIYEEQNYTVWQNVWFRSTAGSYHVTGLLDPRQPPKDYEGAGGGVPSSSMPFFAGNVTLTLSGRELNPQPGGRGALDFNLDCKEPLRNLRLLGSRSVLLLDETNFHQGVGVNPITGASANVLDRFDLRMNGTDVRLVSGNWAGAGKLTLDHAGRSDSCDLRPFAFYEVVAEYLILHEEIRFPLCRLTGSNGTNTLHLDYASVGALPVLPNLLWIIVGAYHPIDHLWDLEREPSYDVVDRTAPTAAS